MDYSKLSDFQINMAVHGFLGLDLHDCTEVAGSQTKIRSTGGHCVDYCNNPADAWPIIVGHKLSLINADDEWLCVPDDTAVDGTTGDEVQMIYSCDGHVHANPLRAAMIVFLIMQESANVQTNPARPDIR